MKKTLIWATVIIVLYLTISTFSYFYEKSHPVQESINLSPIDPFEESRRRADSIEQELKYQQEFERIKEEKRRRDSLKALQQALEQISSEDNPYEQGYDDGYEEGYEEGLEEGSNNN